MVLGKIATQPMSKLPNSPPKLAAPMDAISSWITIAGVWDEVLSRITP